MYLLSNSFLELERNESSNPEKLVVTEKSGPVFLIAINRPEKRNCVNIETGKQLLAAVQEFENDDSAKVGVLYGKGNTKKIVLLK